MSSSFFMGKIPASIQVHKRSKAIDSEWKKYILSALEALFEDKPLLEDPPSDECLELLHKCVLQMQQAKAWEDEYIIRKENVYSYFSEIIAKVSCGKNVVIYFIETKERVSPESARERFINIKYIDDITSNALTIKQGFYLWYNSTPAKYDFIFDPKLINKKAYNLFNGWKYESDESKNCSLYLEHIKENVCSASEEYYEYILDWMASIIQKPWIKTGVAIAITGIQGNGKTEFVNHFKELVSPYDVTLKTYEDIDSRFNIDLQDKILIHGDEVMWGGDKSLRGPLKKKITDIKMTYEAKGETRMEKSNYFNFIFTSNDKMIVPLELRDRRYFILKMGDKRLNDYEYFINIRIQMESGGYNKLMSILSTREVKREIRIIPTSTIKNEIALDGLDKIDRWIYENLQEGYIKEEEKINDGYFIKAFISRSDVLTAKDAFIGNKAGYEPVKIYKSIRDILKPEENNSNKNRGFIFRDDIDTYRRRFEEYVGFKIDWDMREIIDKKTYEELLKELNEYKDTFEDRVLDEKLKMYDELDKRMLDIKGIINGIDLA